MNSLKNAGKSGFPEAAAVRKLSRRRKDIVIYRRQREVVRKNELNLLWRSGSGKKKMSDFDVRKNIPPVSDQQECRRCGTCCRKGGPSFHREDRHLIESGAIQLAALYTIRAGEPAWDNVADRILPASEDIIKIKNRPGSRICRFYDEKKQACEIYARRPLECRILKCWDPRDITALYNKNRLARKDLLETLNGLWELVVMHQEECAYTRVESLIKADDNRGLAYLLRYDRHIRDITIEKTAMGKAVLDFLFGLPLRKTIRRYGVNPDNLPV